MSNGITATMKQESFGVFVDYFGAGEFEMCQSEDHARQFAADVVASGAHSSTVYRVPAGTEMVGRPRQADEDKMGWEPLRAGDCEVLATHDR